MIKSANKFQRSHVSFKLFSIIFWKKKWKINKKINVTNCYNHSFSKFSKNTFLWKKKSFIYEKTHPGVESEEFREWYIVLQQYEMTITPKPITSFWEVLISYYKKIYIYIFWWKTLFLSTICYIFVQNRNMLISVLKSMKAAIDFGSQYKSFGSEKTTSTNFLISPNL